MSSVRCQSMREARLSRQFTWPVTSRLQSARLNLSSPWRRGSFLTHHRNGHCTSEQMDFTLCHCRCRLCSLRLGYLSRVSRLIYFWSASIYYSNCCITSRKRMISVYGLHFIAIVWFWTIALDADLLYVVFSQFFYGNLLRKQ
jgi:hypothetical protein